MGRPDFFGGDDWDVAEKSVDPWIVTGSGAWDFAGADGHGYRLRVDAPTHLPDASRSMFPTQQLATFLSPGLWFRRRQSAEWRVVVSVAARWGRQHDVRSWECPDASAAGQLAAEVESAVAAGRPLPD